MERPKSIACPGFYSRTIYSFAIPEVMISEESVSKEFRQDNMLDRLRHNEAMPVQFTGFKQSVPIYDFVRKPIKHEAPDHNFTDQFWRSFWPEGNKGVFPYHFPFQAEYAKSVSRSDEWLQTGGLSPDGYASMVKCRYFPYGAASIHLTEYFFRPKGFDVKEMVDLIWSGVRVSNRADTLTLPEFLAELRDSVMRRVMKPGVDFDQAGCKPQSVILQPLLDVLPDLDAAWPEIGEALAMDARHDPRHAAQYTLDNTPNQGRPDQYLGFGPYACVLLAPDVDMKWRRRRLRNHVGSVAELVAIQGSFVERLLQIYTHQAQQLESYQGAPGKEFTAFLRDYWNKLGNKVLELKFVFGLEDSLEAMTGKKWAAWYKTMVAASKLGTELRGFEEVLGRIDKVDKKIGNDFRKSLSGIFDKLSELIPPGK